MERPKIVSEKTERQVTGEILYLDEMRRNNLHPKSYDELSDMAIQCYEEAADLYVSRGARPAIMDEYERYDKEVSPLGQSCAQLAEELLKLKYADDLTFEDFVVTEPAQAVYSDLQAMRAGEVLAADDAQLALPSDGSYYPVYDIKKKDATLTGVSVRAWGWQNSKYTFTNKPGEKYDSAKDCLIYPSNEKAKWYNLEIWFDYAHPEAGYVSERVTLSIGQGGELDIYSRVCAAVYADTGYEGHGGKTLENASEEDIAAFADLLARSVGNEPEAVWQYQERKLSEYIESVDDETARLYLKEWMQNTYAAQVMSDLTRTMVEGKRLSQALKNKELADKARGVMVEMIDRQRADRNELAYNKEKFADWFDDDTEPWQDVVDRQAES